MVYFQTRCYVINVGLQCEIITLPIKSNKNIFLVNISIQNKCGRICQPVLSHSIPSCLNYTELIRVRGILQYAVNHSITGRMLQVMQRKDQE